MPHHATTRQQNEDSDTHIHTFTSGNNVFLLMISCKKMIIFPTVGVRTSIAVWKLPIVAPQQDRKHLSQHAHCPHTHSVQCNPYSIRLLKSPWQPLKTNECFTSIMDSDHFHQDLECDHTLKETTARTW